MDKFTAKNCFSSANIEDETKPKFVTTVFLICAMEYSRLAPTFLRGLKIFCGSKISLVLLNKAVISGPIHFFQIRAADKPVIMLGGYAAAVF